MCQPIPQPVVDLIIAAGFDLRAEPCDPISHQTIGWTWTRALGASVAELWPEVTP